MERRRLVLGALPLVCVVVLYAWTAWYFGSLRPPPSWVGVTVGAVIVVGSTAGYFRRVPGNAGFFGALALCGALLITVVVADHTAVRGKSVECVLRGIESEVQQAQGEGAAAKTVYHHDLRCPGGYPGKLTDDRMLGDVGDRLRLGIDPERRVSPVADGSSAPWVPGLLGLVLLAAAVAGGATSEEEEDDDAAGVGAGE